LYFLLVHAVIVGCSRVGAELAETLEQRGFTVSIIDRDPKAFQQRLHPGFHGKALVGNGFDRVIMEEAGIEQADIFVSATRGDNSNIVSARVAREHYKVPAVAALIYDPRRARIYERLGIPTVAAVSWSTDQILARVLPSTESVEWTIGSGEVVVVGIPVPPALIGKPAAGLNVPKKMTLAALTRFGETALPEAKTTLQEGDFLHISVLRSALPELNGILHGRSGEERH
jgi:trk system potassium uptake protein TrkA